jgi:DNA-binding NarL/FixJ family response regulator
MADDHRRVAEALGKYVADEFQLVGTVCDGDALLEAAATLRPDVIVTDFSMPGTDVLKAMKQIRKDLPETKVILLTGYADVSLVHHTLDAGASGFVLKVYAPTELATAIRTVVDGRTYVSRAIAM